MRVNVYEPGTSNLLNVRYVDEIGEELGWSDEEIVKAEGEIKRAGRYWAFRPDASVATYYLSREAT